MPAASSLITLLISVLFLIAGNGLLNTLVPLRGTLEGFPAIATGLIGSAYYLGMLAGAFGAPAIIRRFGPVQAFTVLAVSTVVAALLFPAIEHWVAWAALRGWIGFAFAGLYAVIEAWLNARSNNSNRGRVYALYQIVNFLGSACGQEMMTLSRPQADSLFSLAAVCLVIAIIPLALSKAAPPRAPRSVSVRIGWFIRTSPVGAMGALCIGAANGSFFSLAPVYGIGLGLSTSAVAMFMTAVTVGTAVAVYPVARLSDGFDRRIVMLIFTGIGMLAETMLAIGSNFSPLLLCCLGMAVGGSTMVLYTLAISHVNDRAGPENSVEVSAGMLFLYCAGAIVMPAVGSVLMSTFGPATLFVQNALTHGLLAVFVLCRLMVADVPLYPSYPARLSAPTS